MLIKAFENISVGDQKEHSRLINNLSDEEFREYLEAVQNLAEKGVKKKKSTDKKEPLLEELFEKIEDISEQLEKGDLSIERSFTLYDEGLKLLKQSNDIIEEIEKKVLVLDSKGDILEL
jgi:exodeoxyribonuclease VII small subunit